MFENWWHKKESPLLGSWSLGGGIAAFNRKGASVVASGGNHDAIEPGNGYKYHIFSSSGAFTVSGGPGTVEALLVAGGGSGHQSPEAPTSIAGGVGGGGSSYAPGNSGSGSAYAGGDGVASTGSGGGGGTAPGGNGGSGGDGIILVAYPS